MADLNTGIALGELAGGIGRAMQAKKQREYEDERKDHDLRMSLVSAGLREGTLKDPQQAFQFLMGGGKGKGKKGKDLPPMLQSLIGATGKLIGKGGNADASKTPSGQDRSSTGGPDGAGFPQFTTATERTEADEAAKLAADKRRQTELVDPANAAAHKRKLEEIDEAAKGKYGPGTLQGRVMAEFDAFREKNGREPNAEESTQIVDKARGSWQSAGRKESDYKTFEDTWLSDAAKEGTLTPGQKKVEQLKARKAWALAGQSETPGEKLSRAKSLEKYKSELSATSPEDVKALSQTITLGDQSTSYFDLGSVSGAKEKNAAAKAAIANGIIPVSPKQAEQLEAAGAASANLTGFMDQVKSRLPKDAASRPLTSVENSLSQFFQTDEDLAASMAWDTSVLPMLRAMQVSGRITNLEFQTALNARPKISDTVGVAAKKIATINKMFTNATGQILNRGAAGKTSSSSTPAGGAVPDNVSSLLKGKKAGHYKLTDGSEWDVAADGSIKKSAKKAA
jgi:hypothetical protein